MRLTDHEGIKKCKHEPEGEEIVELVEISHLEHFGKKSKMETRWRCCQKKDVNQGTELDCDTYTLNKWQICQAD